MYNVAFVMQVVKSLEEHLDYASKKCKRKNTTRQSPLEYPKWFSHGFVDET
jgi:hypothetical protein